LPKEEGSGSRKLYQDAIAKGDWGNLKIRKLIAAAVTAYQSAFSIKASEVYNPTDKIKESQTANCGTRKS